MIRCEKCGDIVDSDDYPEGWLRGEEQKECDDFWCETCNEAYLEEEYEQAELAKAQEANNV